MMSSAFGSNTSPSMLDFVVMIWSRHASRFPQFAPETVGGELGASGVELLHQPENTVSMAPDPGRFTASSNLKWRGTGFSTLLFFSKWNVMNVSNKMANRNQSNGFRSRTGIPVKKTILFATQAIVLLLVATGTILAGDLPAFPGAEGYGASTAGGRGGRVITVTNLDPSGPGSLREACEAEGPRIVVFKVAGTIDGDIRIRNDHITIAGQTAPGDGITIKGNRRHRRQ